MRILIVEDELLPAEVLKDHLVALGYEVVGVATNYASAATFLKQDSQINFCFLDINLNESQSGFDIAELINTIYKLPFVFLTSYTDQHTIQRAISYHPEAYLVKPFTPADLYATIELIKSKKEVHNQLSNKSIVVKEGNTNMKIMHEEIQWMRSDNVYIELNTPKRRHLVRNSIVKFLKELNDTRFIRTHRTFAVNMHHVDAISGQYLLIGEEKIPFSRKYRSAVLANYK